MGPILGLPGLPHLGVSQRAQQYCRIYELQWRASWDWSTQLISAITLGKPQVLDDDGGLTAVVILRIFFSPPFYNFWLWLTRTEK